MRIVARVATEVSHDSTRERLGMGSILVATFLYIYRPKSVRNRCVIEVFGDIFYVATVLFGFFYGCRGFCHRTESDIFLFLLLLYVPRYQMQSPYNVIVYNTIKTVFT